MAADNLEIFVRQIRERSRENAESLGLLHRENLHANVVSILRQELDSLVRAIFLLSQTDRSYRNALIADSVEGRPWTKKGGKGRITDRDDGGPIKRPFQLGEECLRIRMRLHSSLKLPRLCEP